MHSFKLFRGLESLFCQSAFLTISAFAEGYGWISTRDKTNQLSIFANFSFQENCGTYQHVPLFGPFYARSMFLRDKVDLFVKYYNFIVVFPELTINKRELNY